MRQSDVDVTFRDEERASGFIRAEGDEPIRWTAVKSRTEAWYIVLHGQIETGDAALLRALLNSIQQRLTLARAA